MTLTRFHPDYPYYRLETRWDGHHGEWFEMPTDIEAVELGHRVIDWIDHNESPAS